MVENIVVAEEDTEEEEYYYYYCLSMFTTTHSRLFIRNIFQVKQKLPKTIKTKEMKVTRQLTTERPLDTTLKQ